MRRQRENAVSLESMKENALGMYKALSHIHHWLMKDAEIFHRAEYVIKMFDEVDAVLYEIRQGGQN